MRGRRYDTALIKFRKNCNYIYESFLFSSSGRPLPIKADRGGSQSVCIFDTDSVGRDDALPPSHAPLPVTSKVSLYYYNIEMDARLRLGDVASNVKTEGTWTHVFVCIHLSIPGGPAKRVRPIRDASNDSQHNRVASKSIHKQTCTTQSGNKKKCCRAGRPSIFFFFLFIPNPFVVATSIHLSLPRWRHYIKELLGLSFLSLGTLMEIQEG